jgi:hypothetical protein
VRGWGLYNNCDCGGDAVLATRRLRIVPGVARL